LYIVQDGVEKPVGMYGCSYSTTNVSANGLGYHIVRIGPLADNEVSSLGRLAPYWAPTGSGKSTKLLIEAVLGKSKLPGLDGPCKIIHL